MPGNICEEYIFRKLTGGLQANPASESLKIFRCRFRLKMFTNKYVWYILGLFSISLLKNG